MSRRMNRAANRRLGAVVGAGLLSVAVVLAGCAGDNADEDSLAGSSQEHGEHGGMDHPADGGPVPEGMTEATDPAYPVGTEVTLAADHMEGMDGATATIASSTDETVYVVDYEADGMMMTNHKWVVESEIEPLQ